MKEKTRAFEKKSHRQMEKDGIKKRNEITEGLLRKLNDIIYRYEVYPEERFTYVSEACIKLTGYTPEEHYTDKQIVHKIIHPDDAHLIDKAIKNKDAGSQKLVLRWFKKDGSLVWTEHVIDYEFDEGKTLVALNGVARDITDIQQKEKELSESQSNLESVLESTKDAIWSVDRDYRILTVNNHFKEEFLKYYGVELRKGVKIIDHVPQEERKKWEERYRKALSGDIVIENERFELDNGTHFFEIRINPIYENKTITGFSVISSDITERKIAEEAVKESEKKYRLIAENTSDGIFTMNNEGKVTYASPAYINQLGYDEKDVLSTGNNDIYNTIHPEDRDRIFEKVYKAIENKLPGLIYTFRAKRADGSYIWREDNAKFNYDTEGKYTGASVISRDITRRKETELSLIESEKMLDAAQEIGKIGSYETDLINDSWSGSRVFCKMFGFEYGKKYKQADFAAIVHPDDKKKVLSHFNKSIEQQSEFNYQYRCINRKTGQIIHVQSTSYIYFDKNNNPVSVFGTKQDITKLKETESQLRKSERNLQLAQEIASIGNWVLNPGEKNHYWSEVIYNIFERKVNHGPIQPDNLMSLLSENSKITLTNSLKSAIENGVPYDIELYLELPSGNHKWVRAICRPEEAKGPNGHILHGTIQDITEQKNIQQKLIEAKEKAEEADQLKSAFLANMSHEIRTPMNGILGFADMLKDPDLTGEDQSNYIEIIEKSGKRMLDTVNDLIEISKIETKQISLNISQVNFNEIIRGHYDFFQPEASEKGLGFSLHLPLSDEETIIKSDPVKLDSIITNLIKNAIKYTLQGRIDIGYTVNDDAFEFYVKDTGLGVPKKRQQAIFNRFEQADISDKRAFEGSGLGLAITKSYVEMLNGKIRVESEENKGSTFFVRLPVNQSKSTPKKSAKKPLHQKQSFPNNRIVTLIVDDEETSSLYLNKLLKNKSETIYNAQDGKSAIRLLQQHPEINLILMDIKMPLLDGYATTRLIREFNKDVKIIAQTAYALEGDKEKALDAGCNDYLAKPIKREDLYKTIAQLIG